MVFVGHSLGYYQFTIFKDEQFFPYLQNIGVVLFFLLSGFLNAYSLEIKKNQYTIVKFLKHKSTRFYWEYIPGLFAIVIIDVIFIYINADNYHYYDALNAKQFFGDLFFLNGTIVGDLFGIIPVGSGRPLWTLAVEWWICILFGIIYLIITNRQKVNFKYITLIMVVVVQAMPYLIGGRGAGLGTVFMLGVLSYYGYDFLERNVALVLYLASFVIYGFYSYFYKDAYTIYSFMILFVMLTSGVKLFSGGEFSRNKLLSFIAGSTFMLYMIHYSIIEFVLYLTLDISPYIKWGIGMGISVIVSISIYYCIEKIKSKFYCKEVANV